MMSGVDVFINGELLPLLGAMSRKARSTDVTLMVLGSGNVGKSSIIRRALDRGFNDRYDPTIEDYFSIDREINGSSYCVGIIDTSGQQEYTALIDNMIAGADAVMLVFDITRPDTFEDLKSIFAHVKRLLLSARPTVPIVIVANKVDLLEERERISHPLIDGQANYAKAIGALAFTTSARVNEGIDKAVEALLTKAVEHLSPRSSTPDGCCAVL